jgi:hypothetical protein
MEQTSGTTAGGIRADSPEERRPAGADPPESGGASSFLTRGRARRRARFLRKARELAYRDLGGLVFNLHRFGQRNDALVLSKLTTLDQIDRELRAIDAALGEDEPLTVMREAGITACARCAAIHSSEDRFCPNCGLSLGPHAERPAALPSNVQAQAPATPGQPTAPPELATEDAPPPAAAAAPEVQPQAPPLPDGEGTPAPSATDVPPRESEESASEPEETAVESPDDATLIIRPATPGQ